MSNRSTLKTFSHKGTKNTKKHKTPPHCPVILPSNFPVISLCFFVYFVPLCESFFKELSAH